MAKFILLRSHYFHLPFSAFFAIFIDNPLAMTPTGLTILNAFTKILYYRTPTGGRCHLTDRDVSILKRMYDFENLIFDPAKALEDEFGIKEKKIRQIHSNALRKIREFGFKYYRTSAAGIIRRAIESRVKDENNNVHLAIKSIWEIDLPEFPQTLITTLLLNLYCIEKEDRFKVNRENRLWIEKSTIIKPERKRFKKVKPLKEKGISSFENVLGDVIWFEKKRKWLKSAFDGRLPKRLVNANEKYRYGIFWSEKCQKNVQYESGQELRFIQNMEKSDLVSYYLEQPVQIKYRKNKIDRCYTPDFAVLLSSGECILVEVKDFNGMVDARVHRRMEALIEYCELQGFGLLLTNGSYSIDKIKQYSYNLDFESELKKRLNERHGRTIFFKEYKTLQREFNAKLIEFLAIVLNNEWSYYPIPFKLKKKTSYPVFRKKVIEALDKKKIDRID